MWRQWGKACHPPFPLHSVLTWRVQGWADDVRVNMRLEATWPGCRGSQYLFTIFLTPNLAWWSQSDPWNKYNNTTFVFACGWWQMSTAIITLDKSDWSNLTMEGGRGLKVTFHLVTCKVWIPLLNITVRRQTWYTKIALNVWLVFTKRGITLIHNYFNWFVWCATWPCDSTSIRWYSMIFHLLGNSL